MREWKGEVARERGPQSDRKDQRDKLKSENYEEFMKMPIEKSDEGSPGHHGERMRVSHTHTVRERDIGLLSPLPLNLILKLKEEKARQRHVEMEGRGQQKALGLRVMEIHIKLKI